VLAATVLLLTVATPTHALTWHWPSVLAEFGGALLQAPLLRPEYPRPGVARESVYVLSVRAGRALLDLAFDVPSWAGALDLYLPAGSRVLDAGLAPRGAYLHVDHYVPAPELPGFLRLSPVGSREESWSPSWFPAAGEPARLIRSQGLRWLVIEYAPPRPGLFWARCEVPLVNGWIVWPAPFIDGYYVYGGVEEAWLLPEGRPARRLTFTPLPPLHDLDAALVPTLDGPPAVVIRSEGYHPAAVLLLRPAGAPPAAYRYAPDPLHLALGALGGLLSLLARPTPAKLLATLALLTPALDPDPRWPWLAGWAPLTLALALLLLAHLA
jgi:hypothetical protein